MKKIFVFLGFIFLGLSSGAQQCPPEWLCYDTDEYLSDFQSAYNNKGMTEASFKDYLLGVARTNLAKQVRMRVKDVAELEKQSLNGRTQTEYHSSTVFSTDINLTLVETKTRYDPMTKEGLAIAYINKKSALRYYQNEVYVAFGKVESALSLSDAYVEAGFIDRAKNELQKADQFLDKVDEPFFWFNIFGLDEYELNSLLGRSSELKNIVKSRIAELQYALRINLNGSVDLFGTSDHIILNDIKGRLSSDGCSFTDDPSDSDWQITIQAAAREYNCVQLGAQCQWYAFIDASIVIIKMATMQRIYENEISVKGGHFKGYKEAADAAGKKVAQELYTIIDNIVRQ